LPISDLIAKIDARKPNPYTAADKLGWINEVDATVKKHINPTYLVSEIARVKDQAAYALPAGVTVDDVVHVFVAGVHYPRIDARAYKRAGYYKDTADSTKIGLYPVPTAADAAGSPQVKVTYREPFAAHAADTEEALLPAEWTNIYLAYVFAQMAYLQEDYASYNNHQAMYNSLLDTYAREAQKTRPADTNDKWSNIW
jgi:hypothetical protein